MSYAILKRLRRSWTHALGLRLVLGYALLFIASTAVLATLTYLLFTRYMRPDRSYIQAQAYELADVYQQGGAEALREALSAGGASERREELLVRLATTRGETLLLYNPDNWRRPEVSQLEEQAPPADNRWIQLGLAEDEEILEAFALRVSEGRVLQVGMDADLRDDALESMREVFLSIALPVLLLALLGGTVMAYRALKPVRQLVRTIRTVITTGDVNTRIPGESARGEFADLVHLFNQMLGRIERLLIGQQSTLDNVAHDLRTPMTRLRGEAELALQNGDPEAMRKALSDALESSEAVLVMLDTIMDVSEAETGTLQLDLEEVAAIDLARDVVELYRFVAQEKGVEVSVQVPPGITVEVDRSRMSQALANLVDNALKYTPRGGKVSLSAYRAGREVGIEVQDNGMGIAAEEAPRIWDRLYRGDKSRSEQGLGLGLSLVKAIAQAHEGRVSVDSAPGEGSTFTVHLPRPSSASDA